MQQIRILKNVGSYKVDQRLTVANYVAQGMIMAGLAAKDDVPIEVEATKDEPETVQPEGKRRRHYRRRDMTADDSE